DGFTVVCTAAFAVVMNDSDVTPTRISEAAKVSNVGMSAEARQAIPKSTAEEKMMRIRGRSLRADRRAPVTDPIAITEVSSPNSPAPLWNSTVAMVEMKIEKLKPNVPIRLTMIMITTMDGRFRTYRKP